MIPRAAGDSLRAGGMGRAVFFLDRVTRAYVFIFQELKQQQ